MSSIFKRAALRCLEILEKEGKPVSQEIQKVRQVAEGKKYKFVIVGGGTAGLASLNSLANCFAPDICLIEPSENHHYQPYWTLMGGGVVSGKEIEQYAARPTADFIPDGCSWLKKRVTGFNPSRNQVIVDDQDIVEYENLIVAAGLQINWGAVKGLKNAIGKDGVCSNYSSEYVGSTLQFMSEFQGGNALFTFPASPVKCAGAPQKIMYLADEYWKNNNISSNISFISGIDKYFSVDKYRISLERISDLKGLKREFGLNLVEIDTESKQAVFKVNPAIRKDDTDEFKRYSYDFIHVTPPMGAPDFIKESPLADPVSGFVSVNKYSLQHIKYPNVWAIGDCSNLPTSKTATAVASQVRTLTKNLVSYLTSDRITVSYDGYTACPIPVGNKKLLLAEFNYDLKPSESTFFSQDSPSRMSYFVKKDILPEIYWEKLLKGTWNGPQYSSFLTRLIRLLRGSP